MNHTLSELLSRFASGDSIAPIVLDDAWVVEAINFLKQTHFVDLYDLRSNYTDGVFVFESESGTIKIEQTRDIIEKASIRSSGDYNIFLIEHIDTLTLQAGNSLLKLFEDIPDRLLILLTSSGKREKMIETLASRVIFISSNTDRIIQDPAITALVDAFFEQDDRMGLLSYLYREKLEKEAYLGLLTILKDRIVSGHITSPETIKKIETGILTLASTNANARWVVDEVVMGL